MKRLLLLGKWFFGLVLGLLSLLLFLVLILVGTGTGTEFLVRKSMSYIAKQQDLRLDAEEISGTLMSGLQIRNLRFSQDSVASSMQLDIRNLQFVWEPLQLWNSQLVINSIAAENVSFIQNVLGNAGADQTAELDVESILENVFSLPVDIELESARFRNVMLSLDDAVFNDIQLAFQLRLDKEEFSLEQLQASYAQTSVNGNARLAALDHQLQTDLQWQTVLGNLGYSGRMTVSGQTSLLNFQHTLVSPWQISSVGEIRPDFNNFTETEFNLSNSFSRLDLTAIGQSNAALNNGELTLAGSLDSLAVEADLGIVYEGFAPIRVMTLLDYGDGEVTVNSLNLSSPELVLAGAGAVRLEPLQVAFDWNLSSLKLDDYVPDIVLGELSGMGTVSVNTNNGQAVTDLTLTSLNGSLNNYPLTASGNIGLRDSSVQEIDLDFVAEQNTVNISGSVEPELDLQWAVNGSALEQLLPALQGAINGSGAITGSVENPVISGSVFGSQINYTVANTVYSLASFDAEARYENSRNNITLNLASAEVSGVDARLESLALEVSGTPNNHVFSLTGTSSFGEASLEASGAIQQSGWQGELSAANFETIFGHWVLQNPVSLLVGASRADIGEHCWEYLGSEGVDICTRLNWQETGGVTGNMALNNWPLSYFNNEQSLRDYADPVLSDSFLTRPAGFASLLDAYSLNLPVGSVIEGSLSVRASMQGFTGTGEGLLELALIPDNLVMGLVVTTESEQETLMPDIQRFEFSDLALSVRNENSVWQNSMSFSVAQREALGLNLQGRVSGELAIDGETNLAGNVELDFADLAWLESLYPAATDIFGELYASGRVAGNLQRPLFNAEVEIRDAGFRLPEAGLDLSNINLNLLSENDNTLTITGSAASGENGNLELDAFITAPLLPERDVTLTITGQQFQVFDSEEYLVAISPDLRIALQDNVLNVTGEVVVPVLNIDLSNAELGRDGNIVGVSTDVVVVAAPPQQQGVVAQQNPFATIPVVANVNLELGEDIRFQGYGLDLTLAGQLAVEQSLDRPLLAYGELLIPQGSYEIYRQTLNVENGKLIFFGNPRNPVLDISATRETSPGTRAVVGIHLGGSLNNIEGELFSTPALPDSEILAILVTGKSFSSASSQDGDALLGAIASLGIEKGQGITNAVRSGLGLDSVVVSSGANFRESSLGLGKYLSPNLLMRYDIGLFDKQAVLGLEYTLTDHLRLEVETGISQSVDLTYTLEKD